MSQGVSAFILKGKYTITFITHTNNLGVSAFILKGKYTCNCTLIHDRYGVTAFILTGKYTKPLRRRKYYLVFQPLF